MYTSDFLQLLLQRLRRQVLWRQAARGLLLAGALFCLVAPAYLLRGHAVPLWLVPATLLLGGLSAWWHYRRALPTLEDAATLADLRFGLKDTLASAHAFGHSHSGSAFASLTRLDADAWVASQGETAIDHLPMDSQVRLWLPALAVAAASLLFLLQPPSPAVLQLQEVQEQVQAQTAALNDALKKQLEALADALPEDQTSLSRSELQDWLKELQRTQDVREAMRQYARLEQHLKSAADRLSQHEKQGLLRESGIALEKDPRHRQLSQHLQNAAYQQAAAELRKLDPAGLDLAAPAAALEQIAALRSAAKRMAEPANRAPKPGAGPPQGNSPDSPSQDSLTQSLVNLDSATRRLDEALRQSGKKDQRLQSGQSNPQSGGTQPPSNDPPGAQQESHQALSDLENQLQQLQRDQELGRQLQQLRQALSQSQSGLGKKERQESPAQALARMLGQDQGQGQSAGGGEGKGGQGWGTGSVESRRLGREPLPGTDKTLELRGRPGEGTSDRSVESSDTGVGSAGRLASEQKRRYQQQAESFLRRDDIPAEVRDGVKTYFETIQQPADPAPPSTAPAPAPATPLPSPVGDGKPGRA